MIPTLALISWRRNQKIPLCIPIVILWPIAGLVLCIAWIAGVAIPRINAPCSRVCWTISAAARMRGFQLEILSDDTSLKLRII